MITPPAQVSVAAFLMVVHAACNLSAGHRTILAALYGLEYLDDSETTEDLTRRIYRVPAEAILLMRVIKTTHLPATATEALLHSYESANLYAIAHYGKAGPSSVFLLRSSRVLILTQVLPNDRLPLRPHRRRPRQRPSRRSRRAGHNWRPNCGRARPAPLSSWPSMRRKPRSSRRCGATWNAWGRTLPLPLATLPARPCTRPRPPARAR